MRACSMSHVKRWKSYQWEKIEDPEVVARCHLSGRNFRHIRDSFQRRRYHDAQRVRVTLEDGIHKQTSTVFLRRLEPSISIHFLLHAQRYWNRRGGGRRFGTRTRRGSTGNIFAVKGESLVRR